MLLVGGWLIAGRCRLIAARCWLLSGAALVLVIEGTELVGAIDEASLHEVGLGDTADAASTAGVTAGQVCTVLPAAALTTELTGQAAVDAMKRAREVSRWLVIVDSGHLSGAVPTGAR